LRLRRSVTRTAVTASPEAFCTVIPLPRFQDAVTVDTLALSASITTPRSKFVTAPLRTDIPPEPGLAGMPTVACGPGVASALAEHGLEPGTYVVATIHREANVQPERLARIVGGLNRVVDPVVFPAHPRTRAVISEQAIMLADIFPTGYFGAELAGIRPGDTVVVFVCGPVGLFAARSAKQFFQAGRVIAVDQVPSRLRFAAAGFTDPHAGHSTFSAKLNPIVLGNVSDRIFVDAQVDEHQKVLELLNNKLIPQAQNQELKSMLEKVRTKVAGHLKMASKREQPFCARRVLAE